MIDDKPPLKVGINPKLWDLRAADPGQFKTEIRKMIALCYPGWGIIKAKYPFIYLRDERKRTFVK